MADAAPAAAAEAAPAEAALPVAKLPSLEGSAKRLVGKVIVVTGSTQGLGEGIALACAHEGADGLVIVGRQAAKGAAVVQAVEALGSKAIYVQADLTVPESITAVFKAADDAFGRVDGLVNSAAVALRGDWYTENVDLVDWVYKLNFRAPFLSIQNAAAIMKRERRGGSIVNIGSINGHGGQSNLPAYACTKGALMTMTKHSAWALRRDHIRVNYIAVGWMYTPAEDQIMQSEGAKADWIQEADKNHPYVLALCTPVGSGA
jgi:NAD(P)-dependent dehydrogenase (short-subunit alcohol dehydrogenase family)